MIYHIVDSDLSYSTLDVHNNAFHIGNEFERKIDHYIHKQVGMRYYFKKEDAIEYIRLECVQAIQKRIDAIENYEWSNECQTKILNRLGEL